jgi:hypothetical protein
MTAGYPMTTPWRDFGRYGSVGIELVLTILLTAWAGHWLDDRYWHGKGWGMIGGFVLGAVVGFRNLFRQAKRMQKDIERAEARDPEAGRWTVDEGWLHKDEGEGTRPDAPPEPPSDSSANDGPSGGEAARARTTRIKGGEHGQQR